MSELTIKLKLTPQKFSLHIPDGITELTIQVDYSEIGEHESRLWEESLKEAGFNKLFKRATSWSRNGTKS